jgi:urease accessory protein
MRESDCDESAFVGAASRREQSRGNGHSRRDATPISSETHLSALLQLASAALPIGGFSYSGGLEAAVDAGVVHDRDTAQQWLQVQLHEVWARGEAAVWPALYTAWTRTDNGVIEHWNEWLLAARDSAELSLESEQMGRSLALWLLALPTTPDMDAAQRSLLTTLRPIAYATAHAAAASALRIPLREGLYAFGWSLLENLSAAAVKLVPLGQNDGQHVLRNVAATLDAAVATALATAAENACNFAPMLSLLSAQHETQYSRLFRS